MTAIYTLSDPASGRVRYVGKTSRRPKYRLTDHLKPASGRKRRARLARWIAASLRGGRTPIMTILTEVAGDGCDAERYWIRKLKTEGCSLVNATTGGDGAPGYCPSAETRALIGARVRGIKRSVETRARMSEALRRYNASPEGIAATEKRAATHRGRKRSPATCARIAAATIGRARIFGRTHSVKTRARLSEAMRMYFATTPGALEDNRARQRGRRHSPEACEKMRSVHSTPEARARNSAAGLRYFASQEGIQARARISASRLGKKLSQEHCAKIAAGGRGRTASPETRSKLSASAKAREAKARAARAA